MTTYRYPLQSVAGDYARAGSGFLLTAGPLFWMTDSLPAVLLLGCPAILFAFFGMSTLLRQLTAVTLDEDGVSTSGPRNARVRWQELERIDLRYFSTRRDREKGWMQLRLWGKDQSVSIDSTLEGFIEIARAAAEAAAARCISASPVTDENFRAIGIEPPPADPESTG